MDKYEMILIKIKQSILIALAANRAKDEEYYEEHKYHSSEFDSRAEFLREIQDMIFRIEVETSLGTEVGA